jgi:curved DNA-binding protein CbpA
MGPDPHDAWRSVRTRTEACRLLGIPESADLDSARRAYLELVRTTHPDRGGDAVLFQLVQEAWELLRDGPPAQRAGHAGAEGDRPPGREGASPRRASYPSQAPARGVGCAPGVGAAGLVAVAAAILFGLGVCQGDRVGTGGAGEPSPEQVTRCLVDRGWQPTGSGADLRFEIAAEQRPAFEADLQVCERATEP